MSASMTMTRYGILQSTLEELEWDPSRMFTGGPLGMDRTCVPKRVIVMDLTSAEEEVKNDDVPVSWNTTQHVEVVVGPDPVSAGRQHVVQVLVPPLFLVGKHFRGKHPPIPKSHHEFTGKAFAFNSAPFKGLDFRYVAEEVDVHRHLYKQMFIGFEPIRLALLHNANLFPFYDDDSGIPTPIRIMYDMACTLFCQLANLIAVNSIRRKNEEDVAIKSDPNNFMKNGLLIARKHRDPRVENAMLDTANSWTTWGKLYLPHTFVQPTERTATKKKGSPNVSKKRLPVKNSSGKRKDVKSNKIGKNKGRAGTRTVAIKGKRKAGMSDLPKEIQTKKARKNMRK